MTSNSFNELLYSEGMTKPVQQMMLWMKERIEKDEALLREAQKALTKSDDFLFNYHDCEPNNELELSAYEEVRGNNYAAIEALEERLK